MSNIGVKFCGHCNPRQQMREVFYQLKDVDSENEYSFYGKNEHDKVFILCGCPCECATVDYPGEIIKTHPEIGESTLDIAKRLAR